MYEDIIYIYIFLLTHIHVKIIISTNIICSQFIETIEKANEFNHLMNIIFVFVMYPILT